jgi:leucyl aminopeptidase
MKIDVLSASPLKHPSPALVIGCFEDARDDLFTACDAALDGCLGRLAASREFSGKVNTTRLLHTLDRLPVERLLLVGLGKRAEMDDERLRQASGNAVQALRSARVASFATALHLSGAGGTALEAVCEGALLGGYAFELYKTKDRDERFSFEGMTLLLPKGATIKEARARIERTATLCRGVQLARDLVSQPGNVVTPAFLADTAREMAARHNLECRVYEYEELEKLGMNALLAVGKGSAEAPRLVVLEYRGAGDRSRPVVLVGKGITFDSGGLSIKAAQGMEWMKSDMSGAAVVVATVIAAARLRIPLNLIAYAALAENMPSGTAQRPSDVLKIYGGKTVEVLNTDAEGRLVLADALARSGADEPDVLVDVATLTGSQLIALGARVGAIMSNDDTLRAHIHNAANRAGEQLWPMPLPDELRKSLDSDIADIANMGERYGGMLVAGLFLRDFVPAGVRWAHLDIAGPAFNQGEAYGYTPKGGTGVPLRTLLTLAEDLAAGRFA